MTDRELISAALGARRNSYSSYSGCRVGAALLTADGELFTGCNVENASFGLTVCAERTAFFKAVSAGKRDFLKIAVAGGKGDKPDTYFYPCGACRQVMKEFCGGDFEIITAVDEDDYVTKTLDELLPLGFGPGEVKD